MCPSFAFLFLLTIIACSTTGIVYSFKSADALVSMLCNGFKFLESINSGIIDTKRNEFFVGIGPATDKIKNLKGSVDGLLIRIDNLATRVD